MKPSDCRGFTLIEILIALAISAILLTGVYTTFQSQQKAYSAQDQVSAMQQNLRGAVYLMQREIRLAGHDPSYNADAGIVTMESGTIRFTMDLRGAALGSDPDGDVDDPDEDITYSLFDCDGDGDLDLRRTDPQLVPVDEAVPVEQLAAENIDALDFLYLDTDGAQTADPLEVRSVMITLVARTGVKDLNYRDLTVYKNRAGTVIYTPSGDAVNYRRQLISTQVKSRNLGL